MTKTAIIGHRGARAHYPENTLPAYKYLLENNIDKFDLDVVATKDEVLVVYHDLIINPEILCNVAGNYLANSKEEFLQQKIEDKTLAKYLIKNLTVKELQENYRVGLNQKSSYAKFFPQQQNIPATLIPTLQEIIDYVNITTNNKGNFQVEIKNDLEHSEYTYNYTQLAKLLYQFIQRNNLVARIKIQAFDWRILLELNRLEPKIKTAYLVSYDFKTKWLQWFHNSNIMLWAQDFIQNKGASLGIDSVEDLILEHNILYFIKYLNGYSYEPEDNELTQAEVELAHRIGLKVYVWSWPEHSGFVINPAIIKRLNKWQIDGFTTDDPVRVRNLLL